MILRCLCSPGLLNSPVAGVGQIGGRAATFTSHANLMLPNPCRPYTTYVHAYLRTQFLTWPVAVHHDRHKNAGLR